MTRDEILNMSAGREMDALIYQCVFKNRVEVLTSKLDTSYKEYLIPSEETHYTTDIFDAWKVVERLENQTPQTLCNISRISDNGTKEGLKWHCHLRVIDGANTYFYAVAETVPLAICAAALLAVMEKA